MYGKDVNERTLALKLAEEERHVLRARGLGSPRKIPALPIPEGGIKVMIIPSLMLGKLLVEEEKRLNKKDSKLFFHLLND